MLGFLEKLDNIVSGWVNYHFPTEQIEELALSRANICAHCPHAESSTWNEIIDLRAVPMQGMVCTECSCPITKAVRSVEYKCPLKKW